MGNRRAAAQKSAAPEVRQRRAPLPSQARKTVQTGGESRPVLWQHEAIQDLRLNPRQSPATFPINGDDFGNLRIGSGINHLLVASQVAEPEMPINYTSDDFLLIRLHPRKAPTISALVTTRERVGRTINPTLEA